MTEHGLEGLTTNHIAERAGVSVGSVYRYFPDKLAIIAEVDRRFRRARADRFLEAVDSSDDLDTLLRRMVEAFVGVDNPQAKLRMVLMREVPPGWVANTAQEIWSSVQDRAARALERHMPHLSPEAARLRTFNGLHAAQGAVMGHAVWNAEFLQTHAREVVDEIVRLLSGYLADPRP